MTDEEKILAQEVEALAASVRALWQTVTELKKAMDRHIKQNVQVSTTIYPHYYEPSTWDDVIEGEN